MSRPRVLSTSEHLYSRRGLLHRDPTLPPENSRLQAGDAIAGAARSGRRSTEPRTVGRSRTAAAPGVIAREHDVRDGDPPLGRSAPKTL